LAAGAFYLTARTRQEKKSGSAHFSGLGVLGMNFCMIRENIFPVIIRGIQESCGKAKKSLAHPAASHMLPMSLV
jgi:hypothetical protein